MENQNKKKHNLTLNNREQLTMDGIEEVITFNDSKIILKTTRGRMDIKGRELNIKQLNLENSSIEINGQIDSLQYIEQEVEGNFLKKLFK